MKELGGVEREEWSRVRERKMMYEMKEKER